MSAFEVVITPSRLKNKKRIEGREPTSVVMAPFSSKAIVVFEDVPVSKSAKRILKMYNPSQDPIEVKVTKPIRAEHNVTIDWTTNMIPAEDEVQMELIWSPTMEMACKETLQFTDNRNFRKDVMVILKSINNKPVSKNVKRFPTISSTVGHVKTLRLKSPTFPKQSTQTQQRRIRQSPNYKAQKTDRMSPVARKHQTQKKQISPLIERNIPHIEITKTTTAQKFSRLEVPPHMFKENVSPLTPGNILDMIDKMQFTPAPESASKNGPANGLEYLSSLPTPINRKTSNYTVDETNLIRQIRPRRLPVAVESSEDEMSPMNMKMEPRAYNTTEKSDCAINGGLTPFRTQAVSNKTFDLKLLDKSESFIEPVDSLDIAYDKVILNKTATITPAQSRPLSKINEEEAESPPNILQKTYEVCKVDEQLKRDIKLVGTPLRKYSESLKDLSLKSPSSKIPIQGSMPNLNEMESIRSIEQNRYYRSTKNCSTAEKKIPLRQKSICLDNSDASNNSVTSCSSQTDLLFNQNEILAQSSRFNLNEIGIKSRKFSPARTPESKSRKETPPKSARKLLDSPVKSYGNKRYRDLSFVDLKAADTGKLVPPKPFVITVSPPKRAKVESDPFARMPSSCSSGGKWTQILPKKPKLSRTLSLVKKPITPRKIKEEPIVKLYDSELYMQSCINPDPFAATTTMDPFLTSTMYLDERAVEKHQVSFKKWLNALVSIPADLDTDCNVKIDVGRLFNEVRNKELILAPTKEEQSMNYLTKFRLESLRQEAVRFFVSEEMRIPCSKVAVYIRKNAIRMRSDRNLHLDVVMQRNILELLLCFNHLWLRLGLEVVFAEKIHLHTCSDIVGLSTFIVNRLFKDKFLEQKYSKAYTLSDEYAEHIKQFTLQKVLFLILFLDKAKTKKIIKHNPCLFVKNSPYKETREVLLKFSCELLANIGDITRDLKRLDYVLTHKQNFLDEFNYAFNNLAVDLRDGIRLTRVMEIILLRDDLGNRLRAPAISRLQRIHNVNLSLRALAETNFHLKGDITAADIVDGHREKTLSLLWQIIYKFRSPKFHAAAKTIQCWWKKSWLFVVIRRRIRIKIEKQRTAAATVIQSAFRGYMSRKYTDVFRWERTNAAICLQKYIRRHLAQKYFNQVVQKVVYIQRWYRAYKYGTRIRQSFVNFREKTVFIQRWIRRVRFATKLEQVAPLIRSLKAEAELRHTKAVVIQRHYRALALRMKFRTLVYEVVKSVRITKLEHTSAAKLQSVWRMLKQRQDFRKKRTAVTKIQHIWRCFLQMKALRKEYLHKRSCIVCIQKFYRGFKLMQMERQRYLKLRAVTLKLQTRFRANKLCALQRDQYLKIRQSVIVIQKRFRAKLLMKVTRSQYQEQRLALIKCQQRFRASLMMRKRRAEYLKLKSSTITIQRFFRARLQMKKDLAEYQTIKRSVIKIQQKLRATLLARKIRAEFLHVSYTVTFIQRHYRSIVQTRHDRSEFLVTRTCVINLQRRVRAHFLMKRERSKFLHLRNSTLLIQRKFRAYLAMRLDRARFRGKKLAVICIQQRFRDYMCMRNLRTEFLATRKASIFIQRRFRAHQTMKLVRYQYEQLLKSTVCIQRRWRARQKMKIVKANYEHTRKMIIVVQRRFRANLLGHQLRQLYLSERNAIIWVQRRFRANCLMREARKAYLTHVSLIVRIQQRFRDYLCMRKLRNEFLAIRKASIIIQRRFRAHQTMKLVRYQYEQLLKSTGCIQRRWRSHQEMKVVKANYEHTRKMIIVVQRRFRANLLGQQLRQLYLSERNAIIWVQRRFRANRLMREARKAYLTHVSMIVRIQQRFRSYKQMKVQKKLFVQQKDSILKIQRWYRSIQCMQRERASYLHLKQSAIRIQRHWRATLQARKKRREYLRLRSCAIVVQKKWRATLAMRKQLNIYHRQLHSAIVLQRRYRARLEMLRIRSQYLLIKSLIVCIQRKFRANKAMKIELQNFVRLKNTTVFIQRKFRGRIQTTIAREKFLQIKKITLGLQAAARGFLARKQFQALMTPEMRQFIEQKKAARIIQRFWRGYRVRKRWQNVRIRTIRENIKKLKKTADVLDTICWKVKDSVRILRGRFSASEALNVLSRLERMSRTVPHLLMGQSDFISTFCYGIMAQAIRSEVDKHLIEHCSRIILNLARHNSTAANIFQESGLVTIAQMLLRWCDKDCDIFNTLCTLIWVFSHCPEKRQKIREFMTTPEAIYVVRETKKLVARKENMKKNIRKPLGSQLQRSQQQGVHFSSKALPSLESDYGVIRNKPYTFISSVYAFDTILLRLNINIH